MTVVSGDIFGGRRFLPPVQKGRMGNYIFNQNYIGTPPLPACARAKPPCPIARPPETRFKKGQVVRGKLIRNTRTSEPPNFVVVKGNIHIPFGGRRGGENILTSLKGLGGGSTLPVKTQQFVFVKDYEALLAGGIRSVTKNFKAGDTIEGYIQKGRPEVDIPHMVVTNDGFRIPMGGSMGMILEPVSDTTPQVGQPQPSSNKHLILGIAAIAVVALIILK